MDAETVVSANGIPAAAAAPEDAAGGEGEAPGCSIAGLEDAEVDAVVAVEDDDASGECGMTTTPPLTGAPLAEAPLPR